MSTEIYLKSRELIEDPCSPAPTGRDLHFDKLHSAWLMAYGRTGRNAPIHPPQ